MQFLLIAAPLFGLFIGLCAGGVASLLGYGFATPVSIGLLLGAALPYFQLLFDGGGWAYRPLFAFVSLILWGSIIYLLIFDYPLAALICSLVAAALPACWFMNEFSIDNQFKALRAGLERQIDDEAKRDGIIRRKSRRRFRNRDARDGSNPL
jgi:hypothetical protein